MRIPFALAVAAVAAGPLAAQQDSVAAPTPAVVKHTVKRGDTLWDIAKAYLKNPFRWPEVFHRNTDVVKNPHWIYPGEVLIIEGSAVRPEVAARVGEDGYVVSRVQTHTANTTVFLAHARTIMTRNTAVLAKPPAYTVRQGEQEAAPYVVDAHKPLGAGRVVSAVERPALGLKSTAGYKLYDRLYVTSPAGVTLRPGDELLIARPGDEITDLGRVIEPTGVVKIDSVPAGKPAVGSIVRQYQTITLDQLTFSNPKSFIPTTVRPKRGTYPLASKVIWIKSDPVLPSIQTYVMVDAATAQGVRPGDQFTLYDDAARPETPGGALPVSTATVQIVRVTPYSATGLIIDQMQPKVQTGMTARLSAKMP